MIPIIKWSVRTPRGVFICTTETEARKIFDREPYAELMRAEVIPSVLINEVVLEVKPPENGS